jgi:hypothetical protein
MSVIEKLKEARERLEVVSKELAYISQVCNDEGYDIETEVNNAFEKTGYALKSLSTIEKENKKAVNDFRMDELDAVMISVDKWLEGKQLENNPATRASDAREYALRAIEKEKNRVVGLARILEDAKEAMEERRGYCSIWEWKYRDRWDNEDVVISEAIAKYMESIK